MSKRGPKSFGAFFRCRFCFGGSSSASRSRCCARDSPLRPRFRAAPERLGPVRKGGRPFLGAGPWSGRIRTREGRRGSPRRRIVRFPVTPYEKNSDKRDLTRYICRVRLSESDRKVHPRGPTARRPKPRKAPWNTSDGSCPEAHDSEGFDSVATVRKGPARAEPARQGWRPQGVGPCCRRGHRA